MPKVPEGGEDTGVRTVFEGRYATARQIRKSKLVVITGPDAGQELLISKPRVLVGRSVINDLVLADRAVSGTHFEIVTEEDGVRLHDLDSTNGTQIGELRVRDAYLRTGSVIKVGKTEIRFQPLTDVVEIELSPADRFGDVIGMSVRMRETFATLEKVAPSDLTVLIAGETGTGKDVVARVVHDKSPRKEKPFVVLDCSSIPKELMESTVFGHEKGSFTGAVGQHRGAFEQAQGGTIFLDEIGELDLMLQPKLLRVLENREIKRVGGDRTIKVDVRVIAATNRDLRQMVNASTFREDLYYRLSVILVELPALRERREDVPLLAKFFLDQMGERSNKHFEIADEAMHMLSSYPWPGNVRELRNVIERAVSLCDATLVTRADLVFGDARPPVSLGTRQEKLPSGLTFKEAKQRVLDTFESGYLREVLERNRGNVTRAAAEAGLTRYHFRELLKRHGLSTRNEEETGEE